jgi:hypothetical protein
MRIERGRRVMTRQNRLLEVVDRELSRGPALRPTPAGLRARIMEGVAATAPAPREHRTMRIAGPLAIAASLGLAALLWTSGNATPAAPEVPAIEAVPMAANFTPALDPVPIIRPAAAFVVETFERPLVKEGRFMLEDTRRAADFVVSCLPFTGG